MQKIGTNAKEASRALALAPSTQKNDALLHTEDYLRSHIDLILEANAKDTAFGTEKALSDAMLDRLKLDPVRIEAIADAVHAISKLDDPIGTVITDWDRPNGLHISRVRVPLGVIGIIYESRPNVTADAGALCLKSSNAAILRGGSDSLHSSIAIHGALQYGLKKAGLDENAVQLVPTRDRAAVGEMLGMNGAIDIIVPRGGKSLVERVQNESRVPVFAHLEGICHVYVDGSADAQKALDVTLNAKMRRTGICGAAETLLVDNSAIPFIKNTLDQLLTSGCELRGDANVQQLDSRINPAQDADWHTEYLAPILSVKTVNGIDGALSHIAAYSSGHTETIIAEDNSVAERFLREVDSAIVMHNASTQFADGGEFGMGAEIGIATGRIHARGPVGLEQLTSFKYQVRGTGQTRP
ncbi:glutamate-5-semialdehyde dehydrogenase [Kordiimonas sp. SCSIO 12610]|uniref:glutamate-5-semialdehyde dehydrogenase n=1 Tax=Kordiimonas sp. SCSIO 12610 TaxID=2829597 RepID=UPI00220AC2F4|nr:glutamate-5-semialdehyde dehydrogenase [Kordiimonas sp. SCSIO 12610]